MERLLMPKPVEFVFNTLILWRFMGTNMPNVTYAFVVSSHMPVSPTASGHSGGF